MRAWAQHYRGAGVEVLEFSIGDYVLNGRRGRGDGAHRGIARPWTASWATPTLLVEEHRARVSSSTLFHQTREFQFLEAF